MKLSSSLKADGKSQKKLIKIIVRHGHPAVPLDEKADFVPEEGGYGVYLKNTSAESFARLGRTLASLKAYRFSLEVAAKDFDELKAYWLLTALYDGTHNLEAALPLEKEALDRVKLVFETVSSFRRIADTDSKTVTPRVLCDLAAVEVNKAARKAGGKAENRILMPGMAEFESLAGLKAVGRGSVNPPCLGIIDYFPKGTSADSPIEQALVGKGITFDSGGYDLKNTSNIATMRTDKTAAVYLVGALCLAIKLGLSKRVRLYLPCTENLVSGSSMLPGDIIRYPNGVSVEINNTDAEGRLILADGLNLASESGARRILDMATLTGAAKVAVGRDRCVLIARNNKLPRKLIESFDKTLERYWPLPLDESHQRFLSSRRATVCNSGHGEGAPGASVAAAFLQHFVREKCEWVHIDLSSAYLPDGSPFYAPGPTGATVFALGLYLSQL